jgi:formate dehydrogenase beta subunit
LPSDIAIDTKHVEQALKKAKRGLPKGRPVDAKALDEVRALLGDEPRRRDLLIEHLHKIQDRFGHVSAVHIVALASEMNLAMTEVYEVATFYHHFDVIKEGETVPPAITVRVCDSVACEIAGAKELLSKLPAILGRDVRVIPAPCIGRCESAPAAVVHQNPVFNATVEKISALVKQKATKHDHASYIPYVGFDEYKKQNDLDRLYGGQTRCRGRD